MRMHWSACLAGVFTMRGPSITVYRAALWLITEATQQGWGHDLWGGELVPYQLADFNSSLRSKDDMPYYVKLLKIADQALQSGPQPAPYTFAQAFGQEEHGVPTIVLPTQERLRGGVAHPIGDVWGYLGEPLLGQGMVSCPLGQ